MSHHEGAAWINRAADRDAATAEGDAQGKHSRYPAWALPGGRLVPFSAEAFGRWGKEALDWLRDAAHATCRRNPQLAYLGALQRGNAACILQAGQLRGPADFAGDTGWEEDLDDLLRDAAAAAAAGWDGE